MERPFSTEKSIERVLYVLRSFFQDGFLPLLLLEGIFLLGWFLNASTAPIASLIRDLSVVFAVGLIPVVIHCLFSRPKETLFWLGLFLLLWFPGAYLEFPSDPWEHVRRIHSWRFAMTLRGAEFPVGFSYFLGYSWLGNLDAATFRQACGIYAAFWQWLVLFQVSRLVKALGVSSDWRLVHVITFLCFFGTNLFGLRYYALAALPFSLIAYLRGLSATLHLLEMKNRRTRESILTVLLIVACALSSLLCHVEEFIFLLGGVGALIAIHWTQTKQSKRLLLQTGGVVFFMSACLSLWLRHRYPERAVSLAIANTGLSNHLRIIFSQTLGLPGVMAMGLAVWFRRSHPRFSILCLTPLFFLLWPLLPWLISLRGNSFPEMYRLLYAAPWPCVLVLGAEAFSQRFERTRYLKAAPYLAGGIFIFIGMLSGLPWRGRLYFQFHQPSSSRALIELDRLPEWLAARRNYQPNCNWVADNATLTALSSHYGYLSWVVRRMPERYGRSVVDEATLRNIIWNQPICGVFVPQIGELPADTPSPIAEKSKHWPPEVGNWSWLVRPPFITAAKSLSELGWEHTSVPPFYELYEPPPQLIWTIIQASSEASAGDSQLIQFASGYTVLVGVGGNNDLVAQYLDDRGTKYVDLVVLLRAEPGHFAGLKALLKSRIRVSEIRITPLSNVLCRSSEETLCDLAGLDEVLRSAKSKGVQLAPFSPGEILRQEVYAQLRVLEGGRVLRLSYDNHAALLMGSPVDAPPEHADVVQLSHLGDRGALTTLLEKVTPGVLIATSSLSRMATAPPAIAPLAPGKK